MSKFYHIADYSKLWLVSECIKKMEKLFKIDLIYLATLLAANRILIIVEIPEIVSRMGVSEFMSYEIELQNRATQNDVTLRVTNSRFF